MENQQLTVRELIELLQSLKVPESTLVQCVGNGYGNYPVINANVRAWLNGGIANVTIHLGEKA